MQLRKTTTTTTRKKNKQILKNGGFGGEARQNLVILVLSLKSGTTPLTPAKNKIECF